jgi:hypothetical protein
MSKELFDPAAPVLVDPPAIVRTDTSRAEQVIEKVINLDRSLNADQFELGALFSEVLAGDYFHADHCDSLKDFLKKNHIEMPAKEAERRAKIHNISTELGITREQLQKARISKVKAIFELSPDKTVTHKDTGVVEKVSDIIYQLVTDAGKGKSLADIKKIVKDIRIQLDEIEGTESVIEFYKLPVFRSRQEFFDETIELAVQLSGGTVDAKGNERDISRATAVEHIFAEFRSDAGVAAAEEQRGTPGTFVDEAE